MLTGEAQGDSELYSRDCPWPQGLLVSTPAAPSPFSADPPGPPSLPFSPISGCIGPLSQVSESHCHPGSEGYRGLDLGHL